MLSAKQKGAKRKAFGIVFAALSGLPLLLGVGIVAKAYSNHQIQISNDAFVAGAWHNLRTDQVFPDYLAYSVADKGSRAWTRQGIAKESSCEEALRKDFAAAATAKGCKTTLRATYVDIGGDVAATMAVIVFGSNDDAKAVANEEFNYANGPGPLVFPVAVPGTPAAKWTKDRALAGGAQKVGLSIYDEPYVVASSVGPADGSRAVGKLPGQWKIDGKGETRTYADLSNDLVITFALNFDEAMTGKPQ
jgi:hypothetical protein